VSSLRNDSRIVLKTGMSLSPSLKFVEMHLAIPQPHCQSNDWSQEETQEELLHGKITLLWERMLEMMFEWEQVLTGSDHASASCAHIVLHGRTPVGVVSQLLCAW
jgi:hypothetical protein